MSKIFPSMCNKPEKSHVIILIPCWIWILILFPIYFLPLIGAGIWEQAVNGTWIEIGYHVANAVVLFLVLSRYLKEEWFMAKLDFGSTLKHVLLTIGLMAGTELILLGTLHLCGFNLADIMEFLPVVEMSISHTPLALLMYNPIFGTIVVSIFAPFSVVALFYCLGFAPICYRKPWLGYVCVAALVLLQAVVDILWRGDGAFVMGGYIVNLPIHLLACWSYQKTDNVWTPIITLGLANLIISIVQILVF
ncbi:MAG: hypothetical protein J6R94_05880 [Agathobacter sp.]|nr:hypothetical protein [Agathobacter sp.]